MENCQRPEPPLSGTEKEVLLGFLDFLRATLICKSEGLSDTNARKPHDPSGMSLLGITKHVTAVERYWLRGKFIGEDLEQALGKKEPGSDWIVLESETGTDIRQRYKDACCESDQIIYSHALDGTIRSNQRPEKDGMQLRWIITHMIEETARHCGHADLIREAIDGQVGE